jgi:hypothetical protein
MLCTLLRFSAKSILLLACQSSTPWQMSAMTDKFDYHDVAQHAVNQMNAFLLQRTISFGLSKKEQSIK